MWKHVQEIESQFRQAVVGLLYFEWLNCFREPISISKFTYSLGVALRAQSNGSGLEDKKLLERWLAELF
jgi:hypothetical protein